MAPRKLAAGNWKMNGTKSALNEIDAMAEVGKGASCDVLICPPATLIALATDRGLAIGGQDCHAAASGAHTGDVAAEQLADLGASHVILGHSERRADHGESDADVRAKAEAAWRAGLIAVICVGETEAQRDAGDTLQVIADQLSGSIPEGANASNMVIAYEPVWAIGTGRVPNDEQIAEVHALMRARLSERFESGDDVSLLYGGSVKAANAKQIFSIAHVNGALVGGASLQAADFGPIITALSDA